MAHLATGCSLFLFDSLNLTLELLDSNRVSYDHLFDSARIKFDSLLRSKVNSLCLSRDALRPSLTLVYARLKSLRRLFDALRTAF